MRYRIRYHITYRIRYCTYIRPSLLVLILRTRHGVRYRRKYRWEECCAPRLGKAAERHWWLSIPDPFCSETDHLTQQHQVRYRKRYRIRCHRRYWIINIVYYVICDISYDSPRYDIVCQHTISYHNVRYRILRCRMLWYDIVCWHTMSYGIYDIER